ncbi:hypothetical protein X739_04155 [Mesorhizobium sp. LNHC220B00]|nr:hypothetical protein X739_04155 [Mesorhizobium sp. LNHC220B00]ESZ00093.1 hypothetical protein X738_11635 [Mesorhizobium sp. LNHC209A00]
MAGVAVGTSKLNSPDVLSIWRATLRTKGEQVSRVDDRPRAALVVRHNA